MNRRDAITAVGAVALGGAQQVFNFPLLGLEKLLIGFGLLIIALRHGRFEKARVGGRAPVFFSRRLCCATANCRDVALRRQRSGQRRLSRQATASGRDQSRLLMK